MQNQIPKSQRQLQTFLAECDIKDHKGKKILEIGFKSALFTLECKKAGLKPTALEVVPGYHKIAKRKYPQLDLILYDGQNIPLPENKFDYVVSFQVLEHVENLQAVIKESLRVLKPGGIMYHVAPNYHSFYEGHFKIIWLPCLNKKTGRTFLKIIRKYSPYYETLNLTKPRQLKKIAKSMPNLQLISIGRQEYKKSFNSTEIEKVNHKLLKPLLKLTSKIPLLKKTFVWLTAATNTYYPIKLIARKIQTPS
jgi:ubiquinone/menaquinone biosynthesis C-methylase UbiE